MKQPLTILFLVLSFASLVKCDLQFNDDRFRNRTLYAAHIFHPPYSTAPFDPITGPLIWSGVTNNYSGFIVHFRRLDKPILWETARAIQLQGAIGIIVETSFAVAGQEFCTYNGEDYLDEITIPFVSISAHGWEDIIERLVAGEIINATLSSDGNAWYDVYYSNEFIALFRGVLGAASCALTIYASIILAFFIRAQGSQFNIPQVCIGLEIIANIIRIIFFAVDPYECFFKIHSLTASVLAMFSGAFELATFALVTFYWYEAITEASIAIYPFMKRLLIPVYIVMFVLLAWEFISGFLNYFIGLQDLPKVVIYAAINLALLIFYVVTLIKVGQKMKKSEELTKGNRKKIKKVNVLKQINNKMILNGVARFLLFLYTIVGIVLVPFQNIEKPVSNVATFGVLYVLFLFDSFTRIYLFNFRKVAKSSKTNRTNTASRHTTSDMVTQDPEN